MTDENERMNGREKSDNKREKEREREREFKFARANKAAI